MNVESVIDVIKSYIVNPDINHYWHRQVMATIKNTSSCSNINNSYMDEAFIKCLECNEVIGFFNKQNPFYWILIRGGVEPYTPKYSNYRLVCLKCS